MNSKHIILIGFMGSGKSTVGNLLAEKLKLPFIDSDSWIETKENLSVSSIFESKGEAYFRGLEVDFLHWLSAQPKAVVAVGGGLPMFQNNIEVLKQIGTVIYLNVSLLTLIKRLKDEKNFRPLLKSIPDAEFHGFIEEMLSERVHLYKQAHLFMPNESSKPNNLVEKLINELVKTNKIIY